MPTYLTSVSQSVSQSVLPGEGRTDLKQ